jgi:hypothetical protein
MNNEQRAKSSEQRSDEQRAVKAEFAAQTPENGGGKVPSQITEYVEVRWKDRKTSCEAVVLPGETEVLLGAPPWRNNLEVLPPLTLLKR